MLKTGIFSLVETAPFAEICPPKTEDFTFSKVTFWSLIMIFPETSFKVRLSYKTVLAFAVKEQSRYEGILTASFGFSFPFGVSGDIKSATANWFDCMLKLPFNSCFFSINP